MFRIWHTYTVLFRYWNAFEVCSVTRRPFVSCINLINFGFSQLIELLERSELITNFYLFILSSLVNLVVVRKWAMKRAVYWRISFQASFPDWAEESCLFVRSTESNQVAKLLFMSETKKNLGDSRKITADGQTAWHKSSAASSPSNVSKDEIVLSHFFLYRHLFPKILINTVCFFKNL